MGLAIGVAALHAYMAGSVSRQFSTTYDEIAHITAGYAYWTEGDFRFQPENGNLPQRLVGLPLLAMDIAPLPDEHTAWPTGNVWEMGDTFFYRLGNNPADLLAAARGTMALFSGGLCFLVFWWSRRLFGDVAGLLSQGLAAFSPTLLAHGGLATSDNVTGLTFLAATLAWWTVCHRITWRNVGVAGVTAGLLAVSKFSAVLFGPVALVMIGVRLSRSDALPLEGFHRRREWTGWRRLLPLLGVAALTFLIAWTSIWAFYGFRFKPTLQPQRTDYARPWEELMMEQPPAMQKLADGRPASLQPVNFEPGAVQAVTQFCLDHRLFPEAYLHGLLIVDRYSRSRLAFFAGEFRNTGWWTFFPTAFLVKTPLPALALIGLGLLTLAAHRRKPALWYQLTPLIALVVIYGSVIIASHLNIGHRHMLPIYPVLFILAGGVVLTATETRRWVIPVLGLLLAGHVGVSLSVRPHYLAYFNPIIGGPAQAHKLFVDSSLDWGQDLPGLSQWLKSHPHPEPVFISYFGKGEPDLEGIDATRFGDSFFDTQPRKVPAALRGGTFAISATMFQRVYTSVRGPWTPSFEVTYFNLRAWVSVFVQRDHEADIIGPDQQILTKAEATALLWKFEDLQFGRLCHYLSYRQPDDHVGYSILIYQLTDTEVALALYAPLAELNQAIEARLLH